MRIRELPPDEWHKLLSLPTFIDCPLPPAEHSKVVVAEDDNGKIIAHMLALDMVHIEGTWIDPAHRNGTTGIRLWHGMQALLDNCQVKSALCLSDRDEIDGYLTRLGMQACPQMKIFFYKAD